MNVENEKSSVNSFPTRLWKQFSSMKFAIIVLLLLAIVSVAALFLGEFYPVRAGGAGWQEYWRTQLGWSKPVFNLFLFFELHDPFRSWWYQILLLALSLSLFTCIIERIPIASRAMKMGKVRSSDDIEKMKTSAKFEVSSTAGELVKKLPLLFRFKKQTEADELRLVGSHAAIAHFGPILTHTGLLCLALGGLFASIMGFKTMVGGYPGDFLSDPELDFKVRVDSFTIEYYPPGIGQYVLVDDQYIGKIIGRAGDNRFILETRSHQNELVQVEVEGSRIENQFNIDMDKGNIQDYITIATVMEDEQEVSRHRIDVNTPLRHKGYRFYQTSFDTDNPRVIAHIDSAEIVITATGAEAVADTMLITQDQPVRLPDGSDLVLAQFLPDFRLVESKPTSVSAHMHNPALNLEVWKDGQELYHQWTFLNNPFQHTSPDAAYKFETLQVFGFAAASSYKTILAVQKTPGSWLIWLGFISATLGLLLSFYLVPQKLWLVIKEAPSGSSSTVTIGGITVKNWDVFNRRFNGWTDRLKNPQTAEE